MYLPSMESSLDKLSLKTSNVWAKEGLENTKEKKQWCFTSLDQMLQVLLKLPLESNWVIGFFSKI
jgi:hypothetical protein